MLSTVLQMKWLRIFHQAHAREAISEFQKPHHEPEVVIFFTSHWRSMLENVGNTPIYSSLKCIVFIYTNICLIYVIQWRNAQYVFAPQVGPKYVVPKLYVSSTYNICPFSISEYALDLFGKNEPSQILWLTLLYSIVLYNLFFQINATITSFYDKIIYTPFMKKKPHYMFQLDGRINAHASIPNNCKKSKITSLPLFPITP